MGETLKSAPLLADMPVKVGALHLRVLEHPKVTCIMPNITQDKALSVNVGEVKNTASGPLVWAGLDQAFLFGDVDAVKGGYLADVTDGWVFMALEGEGASDVMARLVPIELRPEKTRAGRSFRTQLGHMQALIITREEGYDIGVMSSFARSARHELHEAMKAVAARKLKRC